VANYVTPEFLAAVSAHTGVPEFMLSGDTIAAVWDSAQAAVDWKEATAPQPPTAAVSASSPQARPIPMQQQLTTGDDWLRAWRMGRLTAMGAPQPPPRRNGEPHRNAGPR
jgi:hypothetical protein